MTSITGSRAGELLRDWRRRRRRSQLDLALEAGISARHLSFVETGRSRPSAEMVLRLADELTIPLRERNQLLLAAGHAPRYPGRSLDDPELAGVRDALGRVLAGHEPYPALAVDRWWTLVASNASLDPLLSGVAPELLVPPVNSLRVALHPDGMAPRVLNLAEWRGQLLGRLAREHQLTGDPELGALYEECAAYPGPEPADAEVDPGAIAVGVALAPVHDPGGPPLSFFGTVTTFGTALDVTVSELSVEAFFPADAQTAERLRDGTW